MCTIFGIFKNFLLFSIDLIWWLICIHLFKPNKCTFSCVFDLAMDSNAKGAKKNISPNVIRLQYLVAGYKNSGLLCYIYVHQVKNRTTSIHEDFEYFNVNSNFKSTYFLNLIAERNEFNNNSTYFHLNCQG